jgi:hypothetical protein
MSMASYSASKRRVNSPLKLFNSSQAYLDNKDLLRGISEKEVEIDHLRTALQAVSLRLEVFKDMERDV